MQIKVDVQLQRKNGSLNVQFEHSSCNSMGLFGPSASGKSSLLRCLAGLEPDATGTIEVNGQRWLSGSEAIPSTARSMTLLFQQPCFFQHLSVMNNLLFGYRRLSPERRRLHADQVIAAFDLQPLFSRHIDQLSGGERQRLALARALLFSPDLLLLDEPFSALDVETKCELQQRLAEMQEQAGFALLLVSHQTSDISRLCEHMLLMQHGQITASGPVAELLTTFDLPLAHAADASSVLLATLANSENEDGLAEFSVEGGSLWASLNFNSAATATGQCTAANQQRQLRFRVLARDVSIALSQPNDSSILNTLAATIEQITIESPAQALIKLAIGEQALLSRITVRSLKRLELQVGVPVFAQIKAVALLD